MKQLSSSKAYLRKHVWVCRIPYLKIMEAFAKFSFMQEDDKLIQAFMDRVKLLALPIPWFLSGHVSFVQHLHER